MSLFSFVCMRCTRTLVVELPDDVESGGTPYFLECPCGWKGARPPFLLTRVEAETEAPAVGPPEVQRHRIPAARLARITRAQKRWAAKHW